MRVLGIDACRIGWVAAVLDDGQATTFRVATTLAEMMEACPGAAAIGVDMPLGLLAHGWRQADRLAAARLGSHRSRLFMVPPRAVWKADSYQEAVCLCRRLTSPPAGFSRQAWGLREKLLEANDLYGRAHPKLFEVHPEVSFAGLNGGIPVAAGKKTWNGQMIRRALLGDAGIRLTDDLADAGRVPADDILDAAAAAWSASRIASGQAVSLPCPPQRGADAPIAIWY